MLNKINVLHYNRQNNIKTTLKGCNRIKKIEKSDFKPRFCQVGISEDTLQTVSITDAEQRIRKDYYEIKQIDRDTTLLTVTQNIYYYYKNNCFQVLKKKGKFDRENWAQKLSALPGDRYEDCDNRYSALFKNYVLEYREFHEGINQYLHPTESSFLEIYSKSPIDGN